MKLTKEYFETELEKTKEKIIKKGVLAVLLERPGPSSLFASYLSLGVPVVVIGVLMSVGLLSLGLPILLVFLSTGMIVGGISFSTLYYFDRKNKNLLKDKEILTLLTDENIINQEVWQKLNIDNDAKKQDFFTILKTLVPHLSDEKQTLLFAKILDNRFLSTKQIWRILEQSSAALNDKKIAFLLENIDIKKQISDQKLMEYLKNSNYKNINIPSSFYELMDLKQIFSDQTIQKIHTIFGNQPLSLGKLLDFAYLRNRMTSFLDKKSYEELKLALNLQNYSTDTIFFPRKLSDFLKFQPTDGLSVPALTQQIIKKTKLLQPTQKVKIISDQPVISEELRKKIADQIRKIGDHNRPDRPKTIMHNGQQFFIVPEAFKQEVLELFRLLVPKNTEFTEEDLKNRAGFNSFCNIYKLCLTPDGNHSPSSVVFSDLLVQMLDTKKHEDLLEILYTANDGCGKNIKQKLMTSYYQSDIARQFEAQEDWTSSFLIRIYLEKIHTPYINNNTSLRDAIGHSDNIFQLVGLDKEFLSIPILKQEFLKLATEKNSDNSTNYDWREVFCSFEAIKKLEKKYKKQNIKDIFSEYICGEYLLAFDQEKLEKILLNLLFDAMPELKILDPKTYAQSKEAFNSALKFVQEGLESEQKSATVPKISTQNEPVIAYHVASGLVKIVSQSTVPKPPVDHNKIPTSKAKNPENSENSKNPILNRLTALAKKVYRSNKVEQVEQQY